MLLTRPLIERALRLIAPAVDSIPPALARIEATFALIAPAVVSIERT